MAENLDNRIRAFADVVTIDAWHSAFNGIRQADLHTDVVFGTARVGGEASSPVTFRLNIKRAEIVVVVPNTEPLTVNRSTVSRDNPQIEQKFTRILREDQKSELNIGGNARVGPSGGTGSVGISGGSELGVTATTSAEMLSTFRILVTQSKNTEGHYRWLVEGFNGLPLIGRPWDADNRRLALVDTRRDRTKGLEPTVRLEVRCKREDLTIEDLEIKDQKLWDRVKTTVGFNNRMAAAESYIRDQLMSVGLEVGSIEDRFGQITMASVTADPM